MSKKYSLFIGRWQPFHDGHRWLIEQRLKLGKNVWVAIRDIDINDKQPYNPEEVLENVCDKLQDLIKDGRVIVSIVPDIESINYGRGVGYEIIEHIPPENIKEISATKIREQLRKEGKL